MTEELVERLTQLGHPTEWPQSPDEARLEWVPNPHTGTLYVVRFTCPEFTSICPVTGQPDFAHLVIDYVPKERLVESKSLKIFLGAFRHHGAFHEDCSLIIAQRLQEVLEPIWLRLGGYWYPRGGMPIDVFYQSGEPLATPSGRASVPWAGVKSDAASRGMGRGSSHIPWGSGEKDD